MATSRYFNKQSKNEQSLIEDLVVESIKIHGIDIKYLPRTLVNQDQIFEEDLLSIFTNAFNIEAYPKEVMGYGGKGELLSKFGLEIRDTFTFVIAIRRFQEEVRNTINTPRPFEGDIIYVPTTGDYLEVGFVDTNVPFFTLGRTYVYELKCNKLEYSSERIVTGIPEIDKIVPRLSIANTGPVSITTEDQNILLTEANNNIIIEFTDVSDKETFAQNDVLETESDKIIDFTVNNPFGEP